MNRVETRPQISVVIPTHNRPASLLRLLHALRDGSFPADRFEVVVVADGCEDDTAVIARAEPLPFALRVLEQNPGRGAGPARNLGASHAAGELLVFLDDDIEPSSGLLAEHREAHARVGGPAVAIGPALPVRSSGADLGTIAAWDWWQGQFARMGRVGHRFGYDEVFSGNLSVPAALFQSVGGFDPEFTCREDYELGLRLLDAGARVLFVPGAKGLHHELRDHARLVRRKRAEGAGDARLAQRHPELWPVLRISWPEARWWTPLGLLRRAALGAPPIAALMIGGLSRILPALEHSRLRGTWRKVQAGVMYGWYWRGIADAVHSRRGLEALRLECAGRTPASARPLEVDLAHGLVAAEEQLDQVKPASVLVRFGALEVGAIAPRPGAEPLRGEHFRECLGTELPHALIAVLSTLAAAGHPDAPNPSALRLIRSRRSQLPAVSVVIAAHNAAATLGETLGSLRIQTQGDWEAVVVDDGSTDDTAAIAERYAARDSRIRLVRQARQGPGPARNTGIALSRHLWLLFLDADDWLLPHALEQLGRATTAAGAVDAVHGGWARVTADGTVMETEFAPPGADLFRRFAELCAFPIHVCLFRRDLVGRIGGFDPALRTCEDWDFWQRMARSGARFGRLGVKVSHYRMQPRSGATETDRLLPDGLLVIGRGHSADPRLQHARHPAGAPRDDLAGARFRFAAWVAGLLIGRRGSVDQVLESLKGDSAPGLSPLDIAANLFTTVPLGLARGPDAWDELWPTVAGDLAAFLHALERQSGSWRLARRAMLALERLTLDRSGASRPLVRGSTLGVAVEITQPIQPVLAPSGVERVHCAVRAEGEPIGALLLPVCDGTVSARVLADAIAAEFAWPILRRFFSATQYRELEFLRAPGGISVGLAGAPFGPPLSDAVAADPDQLHDAIGWTLLLQEIWGLPGWQTEEFYRENGTGDRSEAQAVSSSWPVVEVSGDLPRLQTAESEVPVEVRVGGTALGMVRLRAESGGILPSRFRSAITTETGFELCRVAVREAILGQPFEGGRLRARLADAANTRLAIRPDDRSPEVIPPAAAARLTPDWQRVIATFEQPGATGLVLARYLPTELNVQAGRRASLPAAVVPELLEAASMSSPPAMRLTGTGAEPGRVEYLPELLWRPDAASSREGSSTEPGSARGMGHARQHDRHHFEALFAAGDDPWSYETPYEQLKYEQTLGLIPEGPIGKALELACAEGRFTRLLAPRAEQVIAADFSQVALQRASAAAGATNVRFLRLDLAADELPGECDLVVCSEVLYYLGTPELLGSVGEKLARALTPGGHLVLAHANVLVDDPEQPGFDWAVPYGARVIGETLARIPSLRFVRELRTAAYRIQLFQRREAPVAVAGVEPEVVEPAPYQRPAPHVAAHFRPAGGRPVPGSAVAQSSNSLPILMYHSVADEGPEQTARYRVTPERFEEQLQYLSGAGFTSVTILQWLTAARLRRPLPGRAVLLTFDDGYRDFGRSAWPLLQRFGFGALVFLVADLVGSTNQWDAGFGDPVPLLSWEEIQRLASDGVEFGGHSASHRPMTGLTPGEMAAEAIRCRVVLERGLGLPVTTFAYPHGDTDPIVQHLVGASGFQAGFTCQPTRAGFRDSPLALPRIEVSGEDDLSAFIGKLG